MNILSVIQNVIMQTVNRLSVIIQCHYAECHAEFHNTLSVVILSVMQNFIMLSVVILSVMQNFIVLSVLILSVTTAAYLC